MELYIMCLQSCCNIQLCFVPCSFQYILEAPTSPAVRVMDDPLTYLNQGIVLFTYLLLSDSYGMQWL